MDLSCSLSLSVATHPEVWIANLPKDALVPVFVVPTFVELLRQNTLLAPMYSDLIFLINSEASVTEGTRVILSTRTFGLIEFDKELARQIDPARLNISNRELSAVSAKFAPSERLAFKNLNRVLTEIHSSLDRDADLVKWTKLAGMSRSSLYRQFKIVTGMSIVDYHRHQRLKEARRIILQEHVTVTAAAHRLGFFDACNFSRLFAKKFGVSPSSLKKAARSL